MSVSDVGDRCACNRRVVRPKGTPDHVRIRCLDCALAALGDIVLTDEQKKKRNGTAALSRAGQVDLGRAALRDRLRRAQPASDVTDPHGRV